MVPTIGSLPHVGLFTFLILFSDMGKNFNEGGSRVGHVGIKSAFFFPELADAGALFGFKTGHNTIDVRLMSASMIAARKVVLIYAGEELCDIVVEVLRWQAVAVRLLEPDSRQPVLP